jgi:hypothetical protein
MVCVLPCVSGAACLNSDARRGGSKNRLRRWGIAQPDLLASAYWLSPTGSPLGYESSGLTIGSSFG